MKLISYGYLISNLGICAHKTPTETGLKLHYFETEGLSFCPEIFFTILILCRMLFFYF